MPGWFLFFIVFFYFESSLWGGLIILVFTVILSDLNGSDQGSY